MKTKTAMQELIENLETKNKDYYKKWKEVKGEEKEICFNAMSTLTLVIIVAKRYLAKEKQDIIDAYYDGTAQFANEAEIVRPLSATDYFTQKYEQ